MEIARPSFWRMLNLWIVAFVVVFHDRRRRLLTPPLRITHVVDVVLRDET